MQAVGNYTNTAVELDIVRHMILNSIRSIISKFRNEYSSNIVIAVDDSNSWRKEYFPYYKANRKTARSASDVDWKALYECMAVVANELRSIFPYKVIKSTKAEADDIIATLARMCVEKQDKCLIVSGDKDFIQLQANNIFIKQYDPKNDRWISHAEPTRFLFEHVMKGDLGDGVPNVFSDDDHYISKKQRAKAVTTKMLDSIWENGLKDVELPYFQRNRKLIDLKYTPDDIVNDISTQYRDYTVNDKSKIMNYFIQNKLKVLTRSLGDF